MQQLPRRNRHQHPTPPPPWPPFEPALILKGIVGKLCRSCRDVYSYSDAELIARIYTQCEACETRADGRRKTRSQGLGNSGVALSEPDGILTEEIETKAGEETMEDSVEEEDKGEGG